MRQIKQRCRKNSGLNFSLLSVLFLLVVLFIEPVFSSDSNDFENKLQIAIEQAQNELNAERARIQKELEAQKNELRQIAEERKSLSDEIVERKISIAKKQNEIQQIRKQRETLWTEQIQFQKDIIHIQSICADAKTELAELLDMLPASENSSSQKKLLAKLNDLPAQDSFYTAIPSLFQLIESLLIESRTAAIYSADIMDSQGHFQNVRMIRIGQNMYAYYIPDSQRAAIAISDPYQQGGFRWYENLDKNMKQSITRAIKKPINSKEIFILPIDVTGTITAATNLSDKSLKERFHSGGIVMYPLVVVALWLLVLISERFFTLMRESRHSLQFCEQILELCSEDNFDKAEQIADKRKSIVWRILKVCLANRHKPPSVMDDAIQEAFLHELPKLERFLPSIRMLSAIAPMLGLLGTVTGIISTFDMITIVGGGKPQLLAGGISEALITTAAGLIIAIPGLLAYSFLSGRIERLIADAERFAASLSNILKHEQSASEAKAKKNNGNN
ncbi:MAG: MotA/TolQ/ExbB proton channel family protein [Sedimentisphaerales bacterium]|nr:MotA/TolQ/ExbB proton channel family protein [Sedimentisphaerales bacterium]